MALRPSLAAITRSLRAPVTSATPLQPFKVKVAPQNAIFRSPNPAVNQVRGVRTNPFGRPVQQQTTHTVNSSSSSSSGSSGSGGFSFAAPHETPASGPRSFSAPGGYGRLLTSVGIVGVTAFGANAFFNREKREGPMSSFQRGYLNQTFMYLAGGLGMTTAAAVALHRSGFSSRLMAASPWVVLGVGLVASIGGMMGAQALEPGSPAKYACWTLFNVSQAAVLSPLLFFNPALLARAGLYTAGIVGSICYVGATAKDGAYLWMGGPLLAGVTVVALSSLAPMILPATAFRSLVATEAISLYGGLAVFSGFVLWDTQKILHRAQMAQQGAIRADPLRESIGLQLDCINIFVRMVQILAMQQGSRKK